MTFRVDLSGRVEIIEVLRFLAALAVVFRHIPVIAKGDFGVDIFFVISGFVMMLSTSQSSNSFFLKRVIRIIPLYWGATIGVFLIALTLPTLLNNTTADFGHLLKSLFFVPFDKNGSGHWPILFLGWTLNYEMYFYFLFAVALKISHPNRGMIASLLILSVFVASRFSDHFILKVYGNLIVFEFSLGILAYMLLAERKWQNIIIVILVIIVAVLLRDGYPNHRFYRFGLPAFLLVLVAVTLFSQRRFPRWLVTLGGASYALYLTHPYIIQVFEKVTLWFDGTITQKTAATLISLVLVHMVAVAIFKFLEQPVCKRLRDRLIRRPAPEDRHTASTGLS